MSHLARSVFVGRLNYRTLEQDLKFHFEQCGKVEECRIVRDATGASKGFGFVAFSRPQDAEFAVEKLEGSELDGKSLHVEFNKPVLRRRMESKQMEREVRNSREVEERRRIPQSPPTRDLSAKSSDSSDSESSSESSSPEEEKRRHHHHHGHHHHGHRHHTHHHHRGHKH
jgi:RNA recognition motif-containing protein